MALLALVHVFVIISFTEAIDPCTNYRLINEPHRSTAFIPGTTDHLICDKAIKPGWYRFNGGNMPTSCVQPYHCGTHAPIWLQGSHPTTKNVVVNRQACINYGVNPVLFGGGTTCCNAKLNIQVANCGSFYVYNLVRSPGCATAYCGGDKPVCAIGQHKIGNQTCHDIYPKITAFPELSAPLVQNSNIRFACKVPYHTGEKDVAFDVQWLVDGKSLINPITGSPEKTTLTGDDRVAYLDANLLQGNLGKTLKCTVTSYHQTTPLLKSDVIPSGGYFVGMRTSKSRIVVDEKGPEQEIELTSTLPIPCHAINPTECKLKVELKASNDPNDISTTGCTYELTYDPVSKLYKTIIKVKATRDFIDDPDKVHELSFRPIFDLNQPLWLNYKPPSVQVTTKNKQSGKCTASGDPHFVGLDSKRHYNIYEVGDFVMYKSKSRNFEVQIRNWECENYQPCICALVAREGNDVVQVDMCERRKNQAVSPALKVLSKPPLDGTTIYRDPSGKKFYINFPSGARVTVSAYLGRKAGSRAGYLNVNIQGPSDDVNNTEGLCGTFDNNPDNDFQGPDGHIYTKNTNTPTEFAKSWAIKHGNTLFDRVPTYDPALKHQHDYCQCKNGMATCSKGAGKNPSKNVCSKKCIPAGPGNNNNGRRDVYDFYYNDDNHDDYIPSDIVPETMNIRPRNVTSPTPSGMTYNHAKITCTNAFKRSTLYNHCTTHSDIEADTLIETCIEDMLISDSDVFLISSVNAFDDACVDVIMRNESNYGKDKNGEVPPEIVTKYHCPDQCNMKGTCVRGNCVCEPDYTSVDCSVQIGVAPEIQRIRGDYMCDVRRHPCEQANVIADHLMDVPELMCRYRHVMLNSTEPDISTDYYNATAEFKSFLEVGCNLPSPLITDVICWEKGTSGESYYGPYLGHTNQKGVPVHGYMVSVTTDGISYSAEKMFVVYDGLCQTCDRNGNCSVKNDTCLIDGYCRRSGEENSDMDICEPSTDQFSWTNDTTIAEINHYTLEYTGCPCVFNVNSYSCACCINTGCPCGSVRPHICTACDKLHKCEKYPQVYVSSK